MNNKISGIRTRLWINENEKCYRYLKQLGSNKERNKYIISIMNMASTLVENGFSGEIASLTNSSRNNSINSETSKKDHNYFDQEDSSNTKIASDSTRTEDSQRPELVPMRIMMNILGNYP